MATTNTTTTLNGLLKKQYSGNKDVSRIMPTFSLVAQFAPFTGKSQPIGEKYVEAVQLTREQGFTYQAPGSNIVAYNDAVATTVKNAEADIYEISGIFDISNEMVSRAAYGSSQAFANSIDTVVKSAVESTRHRLEINLLYGQEDIGVLDTYSSGATVRITAATWASGIWAGQENTKIDVYSSAGAFKFTTSVVSVATATRDVTMSHSTGFATDDKLYLHNTVGNEAMGMKKILSTSGSLFNIDNSQYGLWKGTTYSTVGELTHEKIDYAIALLADKAMPSNDLTLFISPSVWKDLNAEQAAKRQYTSGGGTAKNGFSGLEYASPTGGNVIVKPHPLVKTGDGFLLNKSAWKRIGTVDVKLGGPIAGDDNIVVHLQNSTGYRGYTYSHQSLFCNHPASNVYLSGITVGSL